MAAWAFASVSIVIYIPFVSGYVSSWLYPSSFPVGKSNVTFICRSYLYDTDKEMTFDIRQNKNEEFIPVVKCNRSGIHRLNDDIEFEGVSVLSFDGYCTYYGIRYIYLTLSLQADKCTLDFQTSASMRCRIFNQTVTFNTTERSIYSIKGQSPKNMQGISIVNRQIAKSLYETDDVLQLQCIGQVESINAMPSKDIRWCKKENGKFNLLSSQDPPRTNVVKRSNDGCTVVQNSVIFYHISPNDTALEIMCETGYSYACGISGIDATLSIQTRDTQPDKWKMFPILIHDQKSLLTPGHIVLDGSGKTIHLQCTASVHSHNTSLAKTIQWCVRKQNDATWTSVSLQGKKKDATSNLTGEITIFSKIEYHVTIFDTDVHFLCQISQSSSCEKGLASSNISIHVALEAQSQSADEPGCSKAGVAILSVLLVVLLISTLSLIMALWRRKQISLFGMVIKIKSKKNVFTIEQTQNQASSTLQVERNCIQTQSSVRYVENPPSGVGSQKNGIKTNSTDGAKGKDMGQECNDNSREYYESTNYDGAIGKQSFYENQALEHERNGSIYEAATKDETEQDYDVLKL